MAFLFPLNFFQNSDNLFLFIPYIFLIIEGAKVLNSNKLRSTGEGFSPMIRGEKAKQSLKPFTLLRNLFIL
jgi:hypothetical protein